MKAKTLLFVFGLAATLQFAPAASAEPGAREGRKQARHARVLANLSVEERAKLRAANRQAMSDPAVQAAKDRQRQATREFRQLKREALLRADPTIQPILDKIPARPQQGS